MKKNIRNKNKIKKVNNKYKKVLEEINTQNKDIQQVKESLTAEDNKLRDKISELAEIQKDSRIDPDLISQIRESLQKIKSQEIELMKVIQDKNKLMMEIGEREAEYKQEMQLLKNKILELQNYLRSKENEIKDVKLKFEKEKEYFIRRELAIKRMELEKDFEEKYTFCVKEIRDEYVKKEQSLIKNNEDTIKTYEQKLREKGRCFDKYYAG